MRFPPIAKEDWSEAQREVANAITAGPRGELRGPFIPLLHSPELAARIQELGEQVRFGTKLPNAIIEVAVLLTAKRFNCPHMWASHRILAQKAGVADDVVTSIRDGSDCATCSEAQSEVFSFCRELECDNSVADATFERVKQRWGLDGAIDLTAVCGYYALLSQVLNVANPPLPEGTEPFGL